MMRPCDENNRFPTKLFSDEATFYLNRVVTREPRKSTRVMWSSYAASSGSKYMAGIINNRILWPYSFEANCTASIELVPALSVMFPHQVIPDIPMKHLHLVLSGNICQCNICSALDWTTWFTWIRLFSL